MAEFAFQYYILPEQILLGTKLVQNDGKLTYPKQVIHILSFFGQMFPLITHLKEISHFLAFRSPVQSVEKILLSVMSMVAEPNINR